MIEAAARSGSARGLIAAYSSLGFLKLRLGALPEADGAARVALRVLQEGDFAAGLGVAGIAAEVAVEAGELDEAQALLELIPPGPPGVVSVLAPAARGRLSLARGDGEQALTCFESCLAMFGSDLWGMQIRDVGYLHARSGAAQAWLLLGDRDRARALAESELADARASGGRRALGIALRVAGLAQGRRKACGADRVGRRPARVPGPARAGEIPGRTGRGAAPGRTASRRPGAAGRGARPGRRLRGPAAGRPRARRAGRGGRPSAPGTSPRRGRPHPERTARRPAGRRRPDQPADRAQPVRDAKTVETHLAHVYAKLGISQRSELPEALAGENLRVHTRTRTEGG